MDFKCVPWFSDLAFIQEAGAAPQCRTKDPVQSKTDANVNQYWTHDVKKNKNKQ